MKKTLFTLILVASTLLPAFSQEKDEVKVEEDQYTQAFANRLDSMAFKLYWQSDFAKAIELKSKEITILKKIKGEKDSTYINALIILAKYYKKNEQPEKALSTAQIAADLYGKYLNQTDNKYAFVLDNLSLYQNSCKQYATAEANSKKALEVYGKLDKNDQDLAVILMHVAENSFCNNNFADAVKYELRALSVLKALHGEHSKEYLDEIPYLGKYYEANGDKDKAEKLQVTIDNLQKEHDNGTIDFPNDSELSTPEGCHKHNSDAYRIAKYYLSHKLNAASMSEASSFIISWTTTSSDVSINIGNLIIQLMGTKSTMPYFIAYMAACTEYSLKNGTQELGVADNVKVMKRVLAFYAANIGMTGNVKLLDKYVKAAAKGNLDDMLTTDFEKDKKEIEKEKSNGVTIEKQKK